MKPINLNFSVKDEHAMVLPAEDAIQALSNYLNNTEVGNNNGIIHLNLISTSDSRSEGHSLGELFVAGCITHDEGDEPISIDVSLVVKNENNKLIIEAYRTAINLFVQEYRRSKCDCGCISVGSIDNYQLSKSEAVDVCLITQSAFFSTLKDPSKQDVIIIVSSKNNNDIGHIECGLEMDIDDMDKKKKKKDKKKKKKGKKK